MTTQLSKKTFLLLLFFSFSLAQETDDKPFVAKRDDMCGTGRRPLIERTKKQFADLREERSNIFYDKFPDIIRYYKDDNTTDLFNAFLPFGILLILWMIFVIASIVVFVGLCQGKFKKEDIDDRLYTIFACVAFGIFVVLFLCIFVFIGLALSSFFTMACSVFDIPSTLIVGVNNEEDKFLGFTNFETVFDDFTKEIDNAENTKESINSIFFTNTPTGTNQAWGRLIDFVEKYENVHIRDSSGDFSIPINIMSFTPGISNHLETQFVTVDLTAERIQIASEEGRSYQSLDFRKLVKDAIAEAKISAEKILALMEELFNPFSESANSAYDFSTLGFVILLIVGIIAIGFFAVVLVTLYSWCAKDKCEGCLYPSKIFIVIIAVLVLFFTVLSFVIMIGSVSFSAFCGFTGILNAGNFTVFDELEGLQVDSKIIDAFKLCSTDTGSGELRELFVDASKADSYDSFVAFLDGLSAYEVYKRKKAANIQTEDQIDFQKKHWSDYQQGMKVDFKQVNTTLTDFNKLIKCDGKSFEINSIQCEDRKDCDGILNIDSFTAPNCSKDRERANAHFQNLKAYISEEVELMGLMIGDLTADDKPSARTFFDKSEVELNNIQPPFEAIKKQFAESVENIIDYNTNFREVIDCRVLRKNFLRFEQETCFKFSYYIYIILVLATLCCVFMMIAAWCACCALRSDGNYEEQSLEDSEEAKDVYNDDFDMQDFEEAEIIPNF